MARANRLLVPKAITDDALVRIAGATINVSRLSGLNVAGSIGGL
jgi:hypothetical protein